MPFTPYHLGPALLVGIVLLPLLDLPTFLAASIIIDLEPLIVLLFDLPLNLHGPLHSFTMSAAVAVLLALAMPYLTEAVEPLLTRLELRRASGFKSILAASVFGVWLHVFLDAFLYSEIMLLYPFEGNPLFGVVPAQAVYDLSSAAFLIAVPLYLLVFFLRRDKGIMLKRSSTSPF